jgi:hypothetical protein
MAWCQYDNPATMAREVWEDGRVTSFMTAAYISLCGSRRRPFDPNTYFGDIAAVQPSAASSEPR